MSLSAAKYWSLSRRERRGSEPVGCVGRARASRGDFSERDKWGQHSWGHCKCHVFCCTQLRANGSV